MALAASTTEHIRDIDMNGLVGRMVHIIGRTSSQREILFVYDLQSSLEQWLPLLHYLSKFANVTAVDLPGCGGMTRFYSVHQKPTITAYADYLASFMRLKFRRKQVVVVGVGFVFVAVTRMLQRFPALRGNVKLLVSIAGFTRFDDVVKRPRVRRIQTVLYGIGGWRPAARAVQTACDNRYLLPRLLAHDSRVVTTSDAIAQQALVAALAAQWRQSDLATRLALAHELLHFDNCTIRISLPIVHIALTGDPTFDHRRVEGHLQVISEDVTVHPVPFTAAELINVNDKRAAQLIPPALRKRLKKL